ncbi:hypothetical protein C9I47_0948 [Lysobacter maris]|uniref:Type IV pilus modification protein PilV n=1 Tax=Marilutibacter maris TaxID=1605891 RepID=A0A2U9TAW1_9GAMM|nr:hypothetical protein C9I47_0948 [Lysobacter maris]
MPVTILVQKNMAAGAARRHRGRRSAPGAVRGAGLIEVLVAVLVMAIGLLGIAAMQATALRNSQSSAEQSMAVVYSYSIMDAMRANRDVATAGGYTMGMTCAPPAAGTLAQTDQREWLSAMQQPRSLGPSACGQIEMVDAGNQIVRITVRWDDRRAEEQAAATPKTISTTTRL